MSVTYSAGIATAYGAAVRGGYTGTYEEWCALMADYATVGQAAAQSAADAAESKRLAGISETNASDSASAASGSATAADASATLSESWAVGGTDSRSGEDTNNSSYYAGQASDSASAASGSAAAASGSATLAESWAKGGTSSRTGEDTNNASYYATQAAASAATAVAVEESIPEDYSELSADVVDLKSAIQAKADKTEITDLENEIEQIANVSTSPNLYNPDDPDVLTNKYINPTGVVEDVNNRKVTGFIPVTPGQKVTFQANGNQYSFNSTCFYGADKTTVISGGTYNDYSVTVPENAAYVRVTFSAEVEDVQVECNIGGTISPYNPYGNIVSLILDDTFVSEKHPASAKATNDLIDTKISDLKEIVTSAIADIATEERASENLYNPSDPDVLTDKYINPNGVIETVSSRTVTGYLPVVSGKKVVLSRLTNSGREETGWSSICFYATDKTVVSGGQYNTNKLTVPNNAVYARVTFATDFVDVQIECNATGDMTAYKPYSLETVLNSEIKIPANVINDCAPVYSAFRWTGSLADGDIIRLPVNNVKNQQVYVFSGNISTLGTISIGRIYPNNTTYGAFDIDDTNVVFHCDNGEEYTLPHGLTIQNDIQLLIATENTYNMSKAYLVSNGAKFDIFANLPQKRFLGDEGAPFIKSDGTSMTGCSFSWTSRNIAKPVWMFGDSYMSTYQSRWVYWLIDDGYDKSCMINARAGEGSLEALASLNNLLSLKSRPRYLLWALGMNDGDTTTAVNANWKSCYDQVVALCEQNGIVPIFATIPNTPTIINTYKNAIVKSSGYRYIDFADAVGASSQGSAWFNGMLDSDNAHPTIAGAMALYLKALADFPEIVDLA